VSPLLAQTWRPASLQPGSVEIYSTGRANLPGLLSHKTLLTGFGALVTELIEFSSAAPNQVQDEGCADKMDVKLVGEDEVNDDMNDDEDLWLGWAENP